MAETTEEEKPDDAGTKTTADFEALTDSLRSRVDLFGKGLAGLATVGTGAVGLTTVTDLAPRGPGSLVAALGAIAGLLWAAVCAIRVAGRLMQVNQPVVLEVDATAADLPTESGFDDAAGFNDLDRIYTSTAERFGFSSLEGLSARERELRRAASRASSDDERERRKALADELKGEIDHALARARWAIVRRRASEAASGESSRNLYIGVAAGLLAFAFLADVATSNQADNIDTAKACAAARKDGAVDGDLKNTKCYVPPEKKGEDKDDTADEETDEAKAVRENVALAQVADQLVGVLDACYGLARSEAETDSARPLLTSDCDSVKAALDGMLESIKQASEDLADQDGD